MNEHTTSVLLAASSAAGPYVAYSRAEDSQSTKHLFDTRNDGLTLPHCGGIPRNIVIVLTDDHRFDALGFLGTQDFVQTPVIDRLARYFLDTALLTSRRACLSGCCSPVAPAASRTKFPMWMVTVTINLLERPFVEEVAAPSCQVLAHEDAKVFHRLIAYVSQHADNLLLCHVT